MRQKRLCTPDLLHQDDSFEGSNLPSHSSQQAFLRSKVSASAAPAFQSGSPTLRQGSGRGTAEDKAEDSGSEYLSCGSPFESEFSSVPASRRKAARPSSASSARKMAPQQCQGRAPRPGSAQQRLPKGPTAQLRGSALPQSPFIASGQPQGLPSVKQGAGVRTEVAPLIPSQSPRPSSASKKASEGLKQVQRDTRQAAHQVHLRRPPPIAVATARKVLPPVVFKQQGGSPASVRGKPAQMGAAQVNDRPAWNRGPVKKLPASPSMSVHKAARPFSKPSPSSPTRKAPAPSSPVREPVPPSPVKNSLPSSPNSKVAAAPASVSKGLDSKVVDKGAEPSEAAGNVGTPYLASKAEPSSPVRKSTAAFANGKAADSRASLSAAASRSALPRSPTKNPGARSPARAWQARAVPPQPSRFKPQGFDTANLPPVERVVAESPLASAQELPLEIACRNPRSPTTAPESFRPNSLQGSALTPILGSLTVPSGMSCQDTPNSSTRSCELLPCKRRHQ